MIRKKYATTGLFGPLLAMIMFLLYSSIAGAQVPPANDNFAGATVITAPFSGAGTTVGATIAGTDPVIACSASAENPGVWYAITPATSGTLTVSTGGLLDTVLGVWTGTEGALTSVGCNDDSEFLGMNSQVAAVVTAGTTYYIEVAGYNGEQNAFTLNASVGVTPVAPANDNIAAATVVAALPFTASQSTLASTIEPSDPVVACAVPPGKLNSVWYRFTPAASGWVEVTDTGSAIDTVLSVWTGTPGALVAVGCSDDAFGTAHRASVLFNAAAGTTYYIEVGGYNNVTGDITLNLNSAAAPPPPPANDNIAGAVVMTLPFAGTGTTVGATIAATDPIMGCTFPSKPASVWYKFTTPGAGYVTVGTEAAAPLAVALWIDNAGTLVPSGCSDNNPVTGPNATVNTPVLAATTYFVEVAGINSQPIAFSLNAVFTPDVAQGPANDNIASASLIPMLPHSDAMSIAGATVEAADPAIPCAEPAAQLPNAWWVYTAVENGTLQVSTEDSAIDAIAAVWMGTPGALTNVACGDDGPGSGDTMMVSVTAGTTYYIEVAGVNGATGDIVLTVSKPGMQVYEAKIGKESSDSGSTYTADIRVLNTSAMANTVFLEVFGEDDDVPVYTATQVLAPMGATSFNLTSLPLPVGFEGSAVISAEAPVMVIVNSSDYSTKNRGYTSSGSGSTTVNLPAIFKNAWGWTTVFNVQNTSSSPANLTITFYDLDGNVVTAISDTLLARSVKQYDQAALAALGDFFAGSVKINSTQPIVASVAEDSAVRPDPAAYSGFSAAAGATTLHAPSILKNMWGWISDIRIQNVGAGSAAVTIEFYALDGTLTTTLTDTIAQGATHGFNQQDLAALGDAWAGSVKITSTQPVVAIINEVHETGAFLSYEAFSAAGGSQTVYAPSVLKNAWGWVSDIRVQNLGAGTANVTIEFYDFNGTLTHTLSDTIPANSVKGFNQGFIAELGASWEGWAKITSSQPVVAIVNEILESGGGIAYSAIK